jgi:hypothetical protein
MSFFQRKSAFFSNKTLAGGVVTTIQALIAVANILVTTIRTLSATARITVLTVQTLSQVEHVLQIQTIQTLSG